MTVDSEESLPRTVLMLAVTLVRGAGGLLVPVCCVDALDLRAGST